MSEKNLHFENYVKEKWVDYNGHMNDAAYALVFSLAVEDFMDVIGLDLEERLRSSYTIYTLENHICYLKEVYKGHRLHIKAQLLDRDLKRLHLFLKMENDEGETLATSEQILLSMHLQQRKAIPFPDNVLEAIEEIWKSHQFLDLPEQVGRKMGLKK